MDLNKRQEKNKNFPVSIVIPNYNGQRLLAKNLPKVISTIGEAEIIVVDDASKDQSVDFVKRNFPQVKVVRHDVNKRFAAACNSGVKEASGEIVVLLNNDVSPKKNFLKPLIKHFTDSSVFSVGCREIEIKNGKKFISGRTEGKFKRGFLIHWRPQDQESYDTLWTFGGSMAVERQKYLQLGGMDSLFTPAYWEDIDLCWRARQRGWKILFEKDAVVYHEHETTNKSVFGKSKMKLYAYQNQILFVWKNIRGRQLFEHFLWLPYHLVFTTIRSKGLFFLAFLLAVIRLFKLFN